MLPPVNALDFGAGAADHERSLSNYFYRSQAFERACDSAICLVVEEKGAGKSAIFLMMQEKSQEISEFRNPNFLVATTVNLREHFHLLRLNSLGLQVCNPLEVLFCEHRCPYRFRYMHRPRGRLSN